MNANIQKIFVNEAQLGDLIAESAKVTQAEIDEIKNKYITTEKVETDYMNVKFWTQAGKIRSDRIDVDELFANNNISVELTTGITNALLLRTGGLQVNTDMTFLGSNVSWQTQDLKKADGSTITICYLGSS